MVGETGFEPATPWSRTGILDREFRFARDQIRRIGTLSKGNLVGPAEGRIDDFGPPNRRFRSVFVHGMSKGQGRSKPLEITPLNGEKPQLSWAADPAAATLFLCPQGVQAFCDRLLRQGSARKVAKQVGNLSTLDYLSGAFWWRDRWPALPLPLHRRVPLDGDWWVPRAEMAQLMLCWHRLTLHQVRRRSRMDESDASATADPKASQRRPVPDHFVRGTSNAHPRRCLARSPDRLALFSGVPGAGERPVASCGREPHRDRGDPFERSGGDRLPR